MDANNYRAWANLASHRGSTAYSEEEIQQVVQNEQSKLKKPRIALFGKSGVGKSTLVNNMFRFSLPTLAKTGKGMPVTQEITKYEMEDIGVIIYDTKGVELSEFELFRHQTLEMIKSMQERELEEQLHCVWWLISAAGGRIEKSEIEMIQEMAAHVPVFVVLTMCDLVSKQQDIDAITQHIPKGVKSFTVICRQEKEEQATAMFKVIKCPYPDCLSDDIGYRNKFDCWGCFGCNRQWNPPKIQNQITELEKETRKILPQVVRNSWDRAQQVMVSRKYKMSAAVVAGFVTTAGVIGWLPVPFADAVLLVPLQTSMFVALGGVWGLPMKKYAAFIVSHTGLQAIMTFSGTALANFLKFIPGVGTIAACIIEAGVAAALTAALGVGYTLGFSAVWKSVWSREALEQLPMSELNELMGAALAPSKIKDYMTAFKDASGTPQQRLETVLRNNGADIPDYNDNNHED